METHLDLALRQTVVEGDDSDNGDIVLTVPGIRVGDVLKGVIYFGNTGDGDALEVEDMLDDFEITGDDEITTAAANGTDGGFLVVTWIAADARGGPLTRS